MAEFKFEKLEVWQLSLDYIDKRYVFADQLPKREEFNLQAQLVRAATSVALNIAEGSTSQTDAEQARFLGLSLRSLVETVACRRLARRRGYMKTIEGEVVTQGEQLAQKLFAKLQAMRRSLGKNQRSTVRGQNLPVKPS
jgi:four helix bundle protein